MAADESHIVLTDPEWWKRLTSKGDLYACIRMKIGDEPGTVGLTYHGHEPGAPVSGEATFKSLDVARRILTTRGFRRVDQL